MPKTMCTSDSDLIHSINPTDSLKTLKKCAVTGSAYEAVNFPDEDIRSGDSCGYMGPNVL